MQHNITYSQKVAHTLKQMLLDGELSPGDRVNEVSLATRLGMSRAPIREALHMLVTEGLVINKPQRGKFITALTPQEIRNSFFVGGVLEGAAAAASAQAFNERDFASMEQTLVQMRALKEQGQGVAAMAPLDTAFHGHIFSRLDNALLEEVSRHSCLRISKFLLYRHWLDAFTPAEFYARHVALLDVLRTRTPSAIEQALREHYRESGERLAEYGA